MRRLLPLCLVSALIGAAGPAHACSAFVVSAGGRVLAGNNEDFWNPETRVRFVPAEKGTYGRVYFGFANLYPQGGMNEMGLFFDGFATGPVKVTGSRDRDKFAGNLIDEAMARCATVEEVVELFERYNLEWLERAMLMFGDATGDSVIIEGDAFLRKKGRHQVVTNFYQSLADPERPPCERFRIADRMLAEAEEIDLELARRVLAAVHSEGKAPTQYSNVYDLTRKVVYLYHFHNFENVVVIDLEEELKKGARVLELPDLFPETFAYRSFVASKTGEIERRRVELRARDFDAATLDDYVGRYRLAVDGLAAPLRVEVSREEECLRLGVDGRDPIRILPEDRDLFFHVDFEGLTRIRFVRGSEGEVVRAVVTPEIGRSYEAVRVTSR